MMLHMDSFVVDNTENPVLVEDTIQAEAEDTRVLRDKNLQVRLYS